MVNKKVMIFISNDPKWWTNETADEKHIPEMLENLSRAVCEKFSIDIEITDSPNYSVSFSDDIHEIDDLMNSDLLDGINTFISENQDTWWPEEEEKADQTTKLTKTAKQAIKDAQKVGETLSETVLRIFSIKSKLQKVIDYNNTYSGDTARMRSSNMIKEIIDEL